MSWHALLIVVRGRSLDDLLAAGFTASTDSMTGEEALDSQQLAAVVCGSDLVLIDGTLEQVDLGQELAGRLQTEVVTAIFEGTSSSYVWQLNGPAVDRMLVSSDGRIGVDRGAPVPEEAGASGAAEAPLLDEDRLFELVAARTGVTVEDWFDQPAVALTRRGGVIGRLTRSLRRRR